MPKEIIYLHDLSNLEDIDGTKYEANGQLRSIVTDNAVIKDLSGFGYDEELAYECLKIWKDYGFAGAPSSPASFFRKMFKQRGKIKATGNNLFRPFFHGGWQEAFIKGSVLDTVYLYDIVKAYLWAGSLGFPSNVRSYCEGDENFIGIVKMNKIRPEAPKYFRKEYCVATYFDIENYGLDCSVVSGYSWNQLDIRPADWIFSMRDKLPFKAWKLLTQGYWGVWAQTQPLVITRKDGGQSHTNNYFQNLIFATMVVHRVMYRLWEKSKNNGVSVYVDSVLTTDKIEEGNNIGDFQLKKTFPKGIFLKSAGIWTDIDSADANLKNWFRHAGYKS